VTFGTNQTDLKAILKAEVLECVLEGCRHRILLRNRQKNSEDYSHDREEEIACTESDMVLRMEECCE
jgi:hypothetical protein